VAIGQLREEIGQISIGIYAVHFARADQADEACPVAAIFVVASEECIVTVHGRAADGVLHEVGVDVDATIVQK